MSGDFWQVLETFRFLDIDVRQFFGIFTIAKNLQCNINITLITFRCLADRTVFEIFRIADLHVPQFLLKYLQQLKTCYAT